MPLTDMMNTLDALTSKKREIVWFFTKLGGQGYPHQTLNFLVKKQLFPFFSFEGFPNQEFKFIPQTK